MISCNRSQGEILVFKGFSGLKGSELTQNHRKAAMTGQKTTCFQAVLPCERLRFLIQADDREIRLLEVNQTILEVTPLEAIDFGVNVGTDDGHTLNVLDVTPSQWEKIETGELALPTGWTLEGKLEILSR